MASLNDAGINAVFDSVMNAALVSGRFDSVNKAEPTSKPGNGVTAAIWIQNVRPLGKASGLSAVSGALDFMCRIYTSFIQKPRDMIDPNVTAACIDLMSRYSSDFTFEELTGVVDVRMIDLFGAYGMPLRGRAGYVDIDRTIFRIMDVDVSVILNDMFIENEG